MKTIMKKTTATILLGVISIVACSCSSTVPPMSIQPETSSEFTTVSTTQLETSSTKLNDSANYSEEPEYYVDIITRSTGLSPSYIKNPYTIDGDRAWVIESDPGKPLVFKIQCYKNPEDAKAAYITYRDTVKTLYWNDSLDKTISGTQDNFDYVAKRGVQKIGEGSRTYYFVGAYRSRNVVVYITYNAKAPDKLEVIDRLLKELGYPNPALDSEKENNK